MTTFQIKLFLMRKCILTAGVLALFGGCLMDAFIVCERTGAFTEPNDIDVMCSDRPAAQAVYDAMKADFDALSQYDTLRPVISCKVSTRGHTRLVVTITVPRPFGAPDVIHIDLCDSTTVYPDKARAGMGC